MSKVFYSNLPDLSWDRDPLLSDSTLFTDHFWLKYLEPELITGHRDVCAWCIQIICTFYLQITKIMFNQRGNHVANWPMMNVCRKAHTICSALEYKVNVMIKQNYSGLNEYYHHTLRWALLQWIKTILQFLFLPVAIRVRTITHLLIYHPVNRL